MAANSKREQILHRVKWELAQLIPASIKTVSRRLPAGIDELARYATTQLPLAVVLGKLPVPMDKQGGQRGGGADCTLILSNLEIEVFGYFLDNTNPDSTLSTLADDFYRVLNADPRKNSLAISTEVIPDVIGDWEPYVAFKFICKIRYTHTLGGL